MENTSTVYDDNCHDMIALLENSNNSPLWLPSPSLNDTLLNFDLEPQQDNLLNFDLEPHQGLTTNQKRSRSDAPFARLSEGDDIWEEELDANAFNSQADKKRRLTQEQVKYLEKSFEVENKLEPERKVELAKQLGLQPRQVAVWFQNRRARYKSKQIEKEYDTLKANYDSLKLDYDSLYRKYKNVENERDELKKKLAEKERNEANLNLDILLQLDEEIMNLGAHAKMVDETGGAREVISKTKQAEDVSSAKSDIFDSESPPCSNQQQSSAVQVEASSALMCDLDQQSDFSQEDDEQLMITSNLLMPQTPPTFNNFLNVPEDVNYGANNANNSCNFSLVDEQPGWSWLY